MVTTKLILMNGEEQQKHPGGPHLIYEPITLVPRVEEYLATTGREQTKLPSRVGFAIYLNISRDALFDYEKMCPELSNALKRIDDAQLLQLQDDGMYGGKEVNPGVAIFLMKVNHKMVETDHHDITSGGKPLPIYGGESTKTV